MIRTPMHLAASVLVGAFVLACTSAVPALAQAKPATNARAKGAVTSRAVVDPALRTGTLPNGMRYYVRANATPAKRAAFRLVVNAGSLQEDDDQQGFAHFLEHMAFNGTKHFPGLELLRFVENAGMRFGGDLNAYTNFDETVYMLTVPTDDQALLSGAVQVLHDWASGEITIDSAEVVAERGVVMGEWRSRLPDSTGRAIRDAEWPTLFDPGSRYLARTPIGDTAQLVSATVEPLRRFYRDWYRPDLMAVVAVGDFDADEMERTIRERFGAITAPARRRAAPVAVPAVLAAPRVNVVRSQRVAPTMQFIWREPETPANLDVALRRELVTYILHAELQQRLSGMHVERGSAPFIGASLGRGGLARPFSLRYLHVMALPDSLERAAAVALGEIERIAQHGIPRPALERRKATLLRGLEGQALRADATPSTFYASGYADHYLTGRSSLASVGQQADAAKRLLAGITSADVAAAARFWRDRDLRVLVRFPEYVNVAAPDERRVLALLDSVAKSRTVPLDVRVVAAAPVLEREPLRGRVIEERHHERSGITEWTLSNGARVLLKPTPNEPDEVLIRAWSPGGFSLVPDPMFFGTGRMVARLMTALGGGGTAQGAIEEGRTADVLRQFAVDIGYGDESMSLAGSPRDLETIFQLMHRQFTAPRLDTAQVRAWQALGKYMGGSGSLHDQLNQVIARGNPRMLPVSTHLAELMRVDEALALYRDRFGDASDFTFTIVGAVSRDDVRGLVERYLASLPANGRKETPKDPRLRPFLSREQQVNPALDVPKASTLLVFDGQFPEEPAAYLAEREKLSLLTSILSERLRLRLREELSATYGVGVQDMTYPLPREHYRLLFSFDAAPERRHEVTDELFAVLDEIRTKGVTAAELERVKSIRGRSLEVQLQNNQYWMSRIGTHQRLGLPLDAIVAPPRVEVTPEEMAEVARRYLPEKVYIHLATIPKEKKGESEQGSR